MGRNMDINCIYRDKQRCMYHETACFRIEDPEVYCRNQVKEIAYNEPDFNIQVSYDEDNV